MAEQEAYEAEAAAVDAAEEEEESESTQSLSSPDSTGGKKKMKKKASSSKPVASSSKGTSPAVAQSHTHHKHHPYIVAEPSRELPSRLAPVHVKFGAIADFVLESRDSLFSIIELHQSGPLH